MPKKNKGKKAFGLEYCRGYVDEHGQWNNGFYCPQWGGPDRRYCCGIDTRRYCCPKELPVERKSDSIAAHVPLIVGSLAGGLVLLTTAALLLCFFCRGCWVYKRRKRLQNGGSAYNGQVLTNGRSPEYAVSYSICPHPPYIADGINSRYPLDDPPPYPGNACHGIDEKQPLNPSHLCGVGVEVPEDVLAVDSSQPAASDPQRWSGPDCDVIRNQALNSLLSRSEAQLLQQPLGGARGSDLSGSVGEALSEGSDILLPRFNGATEAKFKTPRANPETNMQSLGRATSAGETSSNIFEDTDLDLTSTLKLSQRVKARRSIELGAFLRTLEEVSCNSPGANDAAITACFSDGQNAQREKEIRNDVDDVGLMTSSEATSDRVIENVAAAVVIIEDSAVQVIPQG